MKYIFLLLQKMQPQTFLKLKIFCLVSYYLVSLINECFQLLFFMCYSLFINNNLLLVSFLSLRLVFSLFTRKTVWIFDLLRCGIIFYIFFSGWGWWWAVFYWGFFGGCLVLGFFLDLMFGFPVLSYIVLYRQFVNLEALGGFCLFLTNYN